MRADAPYPLLLDLLAPPWRRYEIISHSAPAEVVAAIQGATEERRYFRMPFSATRDFEGVVYDDRFAISRIIGYRNSLRPLIIGRVEPTAGGTCVAIVMRPQWFAAGSIAAVIAVPVTLLILTQTALRGSQSPSAGLAIIAAVIGGFYLMTSIPFGLEARWASEMLRRLLRVEELAPAPRSRSATLDYTSAYPTPFGGPGGYATAAQLRRHSLIRRAFLVYFIAVFFISVAAFASFSVVYNSGAKNPTGSQTERLANHGQSVYVTPRQEFVVELLQTLMFASIISVMAGGLIIDRFLGVPLFSNPARRP